MHSIHIYVSRSYKTHAYYSLMKSGKVNSIDKVPQLYDCGTQNICHKLYYCIIKFIFHLICYVIKTFIF